MAILAYSAAFIAVIFVAPLFGVLAGAFSGWVVSFFFDETIRDGLMKFGVNLSGMPLWQLGATLGFVGGFFKSHQTNNNR